MRQKKRKMRQISFHERKRKMRQMSHLATKGDVMLVKESLKFLAAALAINPTKETLRHAGSLHNRKTLEHCRLVRHQLPEEVLALSNVVHPHPTAHFCHLSEHLLSGGQHQQKWGLNRGKAVTRRLHQESRNELYLHL
jgi:hypothetical protein